MDIIVLGTGGVVMKNRVITISRQFGSGGRTIGKGVAAKLGIPCYDQELIEMFARESGFSKEHITEIDEQTTPKKLFSSVADRARQSSYIQAALWRVQKKVILDLAEKGPCVIVGRCADYILRDAADCLSVYIHADIEKRAERIVKVYGETDEAPMKRITDKDKRRKEYYELHTDAKWGAAENFHIALDSAALGPDTCVKILVGLY